MALRHSLHGTWLICAVAIAVAAPTRRSDAQQLPVKRALSATSTLPCPVAPPGAAPARNDTPDVRRLMALGHEAAIVGDHRQARDVFVDAARLSPGTHGTRVGRVCWNGTR